MSHVCPIVVSVNHSLSLEVQLVGVCNCSVFCCTLLCVHSSIAIILVGRERAGCFAQIVFLESRDG